MKLSKNVIKTLYPPIIVPIISYYIMYSEKLWDNPIKQVDTDVNFKQIKCNK